MLGGSGDADGEAFSGRGGGRATGGASVGIEGVAAAAWTGVAADEMATHSIKVRQSTWLGTIRTGKSLIQGAGVCGVPASKARWRPEAAP